MNALRVGSVRSLGTGPELLNARSVVLIHGKIYHLRLPSEKTEISGEMTFERNTNMSTLLDSGRETLQKHGKSG